MPFIAIFAALVIGISGSVSLAAEQSHPGDVLYPVKTHVNDEVRAMIGVESNTDAEVEADSNTATGTYLDTDIEAGLDVGVDASTH